MNRSPAARGIEVLPGRSSSSSAAMKILPSPALHANERGASGVFLHRALVARLYRAVGSPKKRVGENGLRPSGNAGRMEAADPAAARKHVYYAVFRRDDQGFELLFGIFAVEVRWDGFFRVLVVQAVDHIGGNGGEFFQNAADDGVHGSERGNDEHVARLRGEFAAVEEMVRLALQPAAKGGWIVVAFPIGKTAQEKHSLRVWPPGREKPRPCG